MCIGNLSLYFFSGGGGNFVLSTSLVGYTTVLGAVAPMVPHGYGVFYRIRDDRWVSHRVHHSGGRNVNINHKFDVRLV